MLITSRANPHIKQIKRLFHRREREETGWFFAEGFQLVSEAVAVGADIEALVVATELLNAQQLALVEAHSELRRLEVTPEVLNSISPKDGHQGIAAVVRQRWWRLSELRAEDGGCWVAVSHIQHPGSLGTILRVSDSVGGQGVILIGDCTDPYDPTAVRASLGAIFSQAVVRASLEEFAAWKRERGITAVGTSPAAELDYRQAAYPLPLVVVMGSERAGLSPTEQSVCDTMVRIPMAGRVDSHHVAVAAALVLYQVFDRRHPAMGEMR